MHNRQPVYFDHAVLRMAPVIGLLAQRLIENDAMETADRLLKHYSEEPMPLLAFHPSRFAFVRDTLAYFYPALSPSLVRRLLSILNLAKVPCHAPLLGCVLKLIRREHSCLM